MGISESDDGDCPRNGPRPPSALRFFRATLAGRVDGRIYFGVGASLGFMVALAFFQSEEEMLPTACSIGAVIGGLIGKYIARRKWE